jgi:hypothetical protein
MVRVCHLLTACLLPCSQDPKWEHTTFCLNLAYYNFPEPDLINHLVDLFFLHINLFVALLHHLMFNQNLHNSLHFCD